mmetsp:Transcript_27196/g.65999  ORF Transcript_27196/g.65999 Transcript_27196/m.65999 type:complete len:108 (+) Transcript_27196:58-381(+)
MPEAKKKRIKRLIRSVSQCWNLTAFKLYFGTLANATKRYNLTLHLTINRAWRRDLCYKKASPAANLLPLIAARALQRTEDDRRDTPSLGPEILFSLLKERVSDLVNH